MDEMSFYLSVCNIWFGVLMGKLTEQSLLYTANLTAPSSQVIVFNGNLNCASRQRRLSQVISKISGFKEITVDVRSREVILKGEVAFGYNGRNEAWNCKCKNLILLPFKFISSCFLKLNKSFL